MNLNLALACLLTLLAVHRSEGEGAPLARSSTPLSGKLFIAPSSASLAGGKAKLETSALVRREETYAGEYQLKVSPFFFKSENGTLQIVVSDQSLRRLAQGSAVDFTGQAVSTRTGKKRPIQARATPSGATRGALLFSVPTENGKLVFNTSYRFSDE